jgi:hypothetical protein
MANRDTKRKVESFVLGKRGVALLNTVAPFLTTNTHINGAAGNIVLADGQVGFFSDSGTIVNKSVITQGGTPDTSLTVPQLVVYQGTDHSANPGDSTYMAPLWYRPYERTSAVDSRYPVNVTLQPYKKPAFSTWVIKNIAAISSSSFGLKIAMRGRHIQEFAGNQEALDLMTDYITPVYTSAQLLTTNPVSDIINNTVYQILQNSQALTISMRSRGGMFPIIGLAIDSTATSTGTVLSAIVHGTPVPVIVSVAGQTRSVTFTQDMIDSLLVATTAAGIPNTAKIKPVDLSNTAAYPLADAMIIMGLDRQQAFLDYEPLVKTKLEVGLNYGFAYGTTYNKQLSFAQEAQGSGAQYFLKYRVTQGQRKYNHLTIEVPIVDFPNIFDKTETYDTIVIDHSVSNVIDASGAHINSPLKEFIVFPTAVKGVEGVSTAYTDTFTYINRWLASANMPSATQNG